MLDDINDDELYLMSKFSKIEKIILLILAMVYLLIFRYSLSIKAQYNINNYEINNIDIVQIK